VNKLPVLIFSIAIVVFSAFSTASAQDLQASWLEYQNARTLLNESFVAIDESWAIFNSSWNITENYQQVDASYVETIRAWNEVKAAEALVASTLGIILESPGGRVGGLPPLRSSRPQRSSNTVPWTPEPTWGSWEELNKAWASLDSGWAEANTAWNRLDILWVDLGEQSGVIADYWAKVDAEWANINAAWAAINAAWAGQN